MNTGNTEIRFKSSLDQISLLFPNMHVSKTCKFTINCRIMNFTHIEATTPFSRRTQSQRQLHIKDMSFQEQFISRMILLWTNSYQWHFISRETHVKHTSYQGKLISRALHIKSDSLWTNSIVKNTLIFKRNLSQRPLLYSAQNAATVLYMQLLLIIYAIYCLPRYCIKAVVTILTSWGILPWC